MSGTGTPMQMYPVYLRRLDERTTVLVGGDEEAEGKAEELLERNARLKVVSPNLTERLRAWADQGRFEWIHRAYRPGDLEGAFMVIVAEYEGNTNEQVYREAEDRGLLVNVMDDIPHANFAFGSIVRQGPLTISISTGGAAPALAVRLRQRFEKEFGPEYGRFLELMRKLRKPMARHHPEFETRKTIWYELIDSEILDRVREGRMEEAHRLVSEIAGKQVLHEALETGKHLN